MKPTTTAKWFCGWNMCKMVPNYQIVVAYWLWISATFSCISPFWFGMRFGSPNHWFCRTTEPDRTSGSAELPNRTEKFGRTLIKSALKKRALSKARTQYTVSIFFSLQNLKMWKPIHWAGPLIGTFDYLRREKLCCWTIWEIVAGICTVVRTSEEAWGCTYQWATQKYPILPWNLSKKLNVNK